MPSTTLRIPDNTTIGTNFPGGAPVVRCRSIKGRKRSWSNTPNFWSLPKDSLPVNSYVDETYTVTQPVMVNSQVLLTPEGTLVSRSYDGRDDVGLESVITAYASVANASVRSESSQINETALKALVKIADAKANLAVSFKEASKTSDLILDRANRIFRAYSSFRRGQFRQVARHLGLSRGTVHNTWLEYKYGWSPLLAETKGAAEFFAQQSLGGRPKRFSVSAQTTDIGTNVATGAQEGWNNMTRSVSYSRTCKVKIDCEVSNPHFSSLQQVGLTNPLLYAWEVIPFSFVFDWFVSVGDYLTGLSALHGINVRRSMRSFEKSMKITRVANQFGFVSGPYRYLPYQSEIRCDYRAYQRDQLSVDPTSFYPPLGSGVDSFSRLASGLALIRSNSRRFS